MNHFFKSWVRAGVSALSLAVFASAAQAEDTIRWGNIAAAALSHMPSVILELDPEIAARHDLKVEIVDFRGGNSNCIAALIARSVDICQNGVSSGMHAISEGAPLQAFATISGQYVEIVLSDDTVKRIGVGPDAPVAERLAALKGLEIASGPPSTTIYYMLQGMLEQADMEVSDLNMRVLVDPVAMVEGVRTNQFDGAMWAVGSLGPTLADGSGIRYLLMSRDFPEIAQYAAVAAFANADWLEANPELAKRARAALSDAIKAAKADPAKYSKLLKDKYQPDLDQVVWDDAFEQALAIYIDDVNGSREGWDFWLDRMAADTGKDYSNVSYDKSVWKEAQSD